MFFANLVAALISTVILIFTAFFVLFKNRGNQSPVYYSFYNLSGAGIMLSMFLTYYFNDSPQLTQINRLAQVTTLLFSCSLLNLSLTYPEKEKKVKSYILLLVSLPAIAMAFAVYFTDLSIYNVRFENFSLKREIGPLYNYYASLSFLYFLVCIIIFIYNYIKIKIETYRLQIRYVILTTSIFIILTYIGSILLPRVFNNYRFYVLFPTLTSAAATITLFYSVIAYNIMDIRTAIHKTAMYVSLSIAVFIPLIGVLALKDKGILRIEDGIPAGLLVIIFALFVFFLQPVIDRTFKKKMVDIEYITNRYIQKASGLKTFDEHIQAGIDEIHKGLGLTRSVFFKYDDERRMFVKVYDTLKNQETEDVLDRNFPLIQWFTRNQTILPVNRIYTDDESFRTNRDTVASFFNKYDINAILPIYYENRIYGLMCLGIKENMSSITPDEIEKLNEFRIMANDYLVTSLAYDKAKKDQFISRSLELSGKILTSATANWLPELKNMNFSSLISPKYETGTDYYDFIQPTNDTIGILSTDVSGIGINNALYSVIIRSVFHACVNEAASPYIIMKRINLVLNEYTKGNGELATAFYAFYDSRNRKISYANAGFPPMELFRIEKNDFDSLDTEGSPLGYDQKSEFGTGRTELKSGDICIIYSKTLINSKNSDGENFGLLRLRNIIRESKARTSSEIIKNLKSAYEKFMGIEQPDSDVTALAMKVV